MENTIENKAKFFAKYFGQKVLHIRNSPVAFKIIGLAFDDVSKSDYLGLKPLSSISDEDAIEVANIFQHSEWRVIERTEHCITLGCLGYKLWIWFDEEETMFSLEEYNLLDGKPESAGLYGVQYAVDLLRSIGYVIGFNGLPTSKLIEYGWVILSKD